MKAIGIFAFTAASAFLVGCSSAAETSTVNASSAVNTTTQSTTASKAPAANTPLTPGTEATASGESNIAVRITMYSVNQDAAPTAPQPPSGGHWVSADVKTCVDGGDIPVTVSWDVWTVTDAEYGNYPSSNLSYNQFPKPLYPFSEQTVAVGDCVRGSILFPVPDGTIVTKVKYAPNPKVTGTWSAT